MNSFVRYSRLFVVGGLVAGSGAVAWATDVAGVLPAALDQPRINALVTRGPVSTGTLLTADNGGIDSFNIEAYFDTGASAS